MDLKERLKIRKIVFKILDDIVLKLTENKTYVSGELADIFYRKEEEKPKFDYKNWQERLEKFKNKEVK